MITCLYFVLTNFEIVTEAIGESSNLINISFENILPVFTDMIKEITDACSVIFN